jgi:hypothetical protein
MAVNLSPVGGVAAQFFTNTGAVLTGGKLYTYLAGTTTPAVAYTSSSGATAWTNPIVLDAAGRVSGSGEIWLTDGIIYKFVLKDSNDVLIATYDNITGINSNSVAYTNQQEIVTATAGQTVFNLGISYQPGTNSLSVFVDGVNQYGPGAQYAYTETDSDTVTFVSGLHVGAEVKFTTTQQQGAGAVDASQVSYTPPFTDSVATNVEAKLAQYVSVEDFGAVGDGVTDDTAAIKAAISAIKTDLALNPSLMPTINYEIGADQVELVPVTLTGGSGMYKVSEPIEFTRVTGLKVSSLNLIASDTFVGDYLVVIGDDGAYLGVDNFIYENSLLNANFKAGGVLVTDTIRVLLFNNEILGFNTNGVYITAAVPPSFGNYETQVVNCYLGTTPSGGTVPPGVVLNDTVAILVNNTDNVFRNNQIFMVGVGIKTLPQSGNDMIQGNHIYSASVYPMDINSYPTIILGNYFDDLNFIIRQPSYTVVTNNFFFCTAVNTTDKLIILQPPFAGYFFQRLTISNNNFLNIGAVQCESVVVDTTNGTFDYANARNVEISGNVFTNVKFVGSKVRQKVALTAASQYMFDLANTQDIGYVGRINYSVKQTLPNMFLGGGAIGNIVNHAISNIELSQANFVFDAPITGDLYIECDINTLSDNTI